MNSNEVVELQPKCRELQRQWVELQPKGSELQPRCRESQRQWGGLQSKASELQRQVSELQPTVP